MRRISPETRKQWRARLGERWAEVNRWVCEHGFGPNRLRHNAATKIRREFGLDAAQVMLGHATAQVTQVYAETDDRLAAVVAAKIG